MEMVVIGVKGGHQVDSNPVLLVSLLKGDIWTQIHMKEENVEIMDVCQLRRQV